MLACRTDLTAGRKCPSVLKLVAAEPTFRRPVGAADVRSRRPGSCVSFESVRHHAPHERASHESRQRNFTGPPEAGARARGAPFTRADDKAAIAGDMAMLESEVSHTSVDGAAAEPPRYGRHTSPHDSRPVRSDSVEHGRSRWAVDCASNSALAMAFTATVKRGTCLCSERRGLAAITPKPSCVNQRRRRRSVLSDQWYRHLGAARGPRANGRVRPASGEDRRASLLWRTDDRGSRRRSGYFGRDARPRVDNREGVAPGRTVRGAR